MLNLKTKCADSKRNRKLWRRSEKQTVRWSVARLTRTQRPEDLKMSSIKCPNGKRTLKRNFLI